MVGLHEEDTEHFHCIWFVSQGLFTEPSIIATVFLFGVL